MGMSMQHRGDIFLSLVETRHLVLPKSSYGTSKVGVGNLLALKSIDSRWWASACVARCDTSAEALKIGLHSLTPIVCVLDNLAPMPKIVLGM